MGLALPPSRGPRQVHLERLGCLALLLATGCVRVYQPMGSPYRPVVVDPRLPNFQDLRLTVRCVPQDLLSAENANLLCQRVGALFENQGARVSTVTSAHGAPDEAIEEGPDPGDTGRRADLILELRARKIHQASNLLSWAICIGTFTVVPAVNELTFAQDVSIRDGTGFLLVSESLEGRVVERIGAGTWLANVILDRFWREEEERLVGDAFDEDLSADLYGQLSQLMFNAKMQWQILNPSPPRPAGQGAM